MRVRTACDEILPVAHVARYAGLRRYAGSLRARAAHRQSSLLGALVRLYPPCAGSVVLDGVDLLRVPVRAVRRAVRVIAQDATLLSGSVRDNLSGAHGDGIGDDIGDDIGDGGQDSHRDGSHGSGGGGNGFSTRPSTPSRSPQSPREGSTDAALWAALRSVGLEAKVASLPCGLSERIDAATGAPFSAGQRQLLALARALVPRPGCGPTALLLADEPTASVDLGADERVHSVLLSLPCTLVMVCHRLQHVHRFDLVATVAEGRVVEVGSPRELLRTPGSLFRQLSERAGVAEQERAAMKS